MRSHHVCALGEETKSELAAIAIEELLWTLNKIYNTKFVKKKKTRKIIKSVTD